MMVDRGPLPILMFLYYATTIVHGGSVAYDYRKLMELAEMLDKNEPALIEGDAASVAVVLHVKDGEPRSLFIKRADRDGDRWSGHVAFPGGKRDPRDDSYYETARRETLEELGFDLGAHATFLGYLKPMTTNMGSITVVPSVFILNSSAPISPNAEEVSSYRWIGLEELMNAGGQSNYTIEGSGSGVMPSITVGQYTIWGLTYRIVMDLLYR